MNNHQKKELCLALMRAESEVEVVRILTESAPLRPGSPPEPTSFMQFAVPVCAQDRGG